MTLRKRVARLPGAAPLRHALNLERPRRPVPSEYHKPIATQTEGGEVIRSLLESGQPALVGRIGGFELDCLMHYLQHRHRGRKRPYPENVLHTMKNNTGFFPVTHDALDAFAEEYLAAIALTDAMGVWFNIGENRVVGEYCPAAKLIPLRSIEPYYLVGPWSRELRGRRVLVIHPFADSIREQYDNNRDTLFDDPDVLPPFELRVIKAVQSIAGEPTPFATWFDALHSMHEAMDAVAYDICIVGAGAYGLPLAAHAKSCGRQAVHMGGATQILFGIKGRRWDEHEVISKLYKDSWIRPNAWEVPHNSEAVEGGCYW